MSETTTSPASPVPVAATMNPDPLPPTPPGVIPTIKESLQVAPPAPIAVKPNAGESHPMHGNIPLPFFSALQTETGARTEKRSALGAFMDDVHVNLSGAVLFGCAIGAIWFTAHKQEFAETATAASMYLFASAKAK